MIKLSPKSLSDLHQTVKAYYDSEGDDGNQVADQCLEEFKENIFSFTLWDSLGTDYLGLIKENKELQKLYKEISKSWTESSQSFKLC